jgi:signal transduction histidine kinase
MVLAVASHELQTPTAIIKTEAQALLRRVRTRSATDADVAEGLTMIADQADRLSRLIRVLLDLSRFEAGRLELERAPTELGGLVRAVATGLQVTTDRHVLRVESPIRVRGMWDTRRLEEVVSNLLSNAIKYSPDGGIVTVRVEVVDCEVQVRVIDQGVGIAATDLPHVFERFYRGGRRRRPDGLGLGLSISRAIVSAHGGRIWAESRGLGRGSTFGFSLPLT